jgi:two-component system, OmpR family, sensor histidine kinase VicK
LSGSHDNDNYNTSSSSNSSDSSPDLNENATTTTPVAQRQQQSKEKTEIWYGEEKAMDGLVLTMSNVKKRADVCGDSLSPSFSMGVELIKNGYIDFKRRGVAIRFITEITKENLGYCKELMQYVDLRHIPEVKGNMAVSETEYVATAKLEGESKPVTQTIYSNAKAIIEQHMYFFENLWINAIPASQKIRGIECGLEPVKTEVLENEEEISKRITELARGSGYLRACSTTGGMQLIYNKFFDVYKDAVQRHRDRRHKGVRWITAINNSMDIEIVKSFLSEGISIRHVKSIPLPSFALSDKLLNSTIEKMEGGRMVTNLLSSNDVLYLNHYDAIFNELWKTGIDAKSRIKDIEEGHFINVDILPNPKETIRFVSELNKSAKEEILILLSSENGFLRTEKSGGLKLLNELAFKGTKVKVLIPSEYIDSGKIDQIKSEYRHIEFRSLQFSLQLVIGITIIDREKSMIFEIKDDAKDSFLHTLGLAIYIEGKSAALSYVSIFESLWKQTEMYQELQTHDRIQKEFINTAAHELRTPIQPILGLTEYVKGKTKDKEHKELLDIVIKNTMKLKKLAEDILDVSKIESNSLNLNKERFTIDSLVLDIVKEFGSKLANGKKIEFECISPNDTPTITYGDKNRIGQVISNLISNSIKFIAREGLISTSIEKRSGNIDSENNIVVVRVKDTGMGIDNEMFPKLFTKFASKSFQGTGLGLYISKRIVEAHGGRIWAENNRDEKGATFSFSIPLNGQIQDGFQIENK